MPRIIVEKSDTVWVARFHNPPQGLMDNGTVAELCALLDEAEASESLRVVILTGDESGVFIRHFDVSSLLDLGSKMAGRGLTFSPDRPVPENDVQTCFRRMTEMPVLFIAAINGTAMGGGFELALACDFRLVQSGPYDLGLPEINLGLLAGAGGTQRLTRLVGEGRSMEMQLLGRTLSPREALAYGIAMECVDGDVLARARDIAAKLAEKSPRASAHIKRLIKGTGDRTLDDDLAVERTLFCDLMVDPRAHAEMEAVLTGSGDIRDPDERAAARRQRDT